MVSLPWFRLWTLSSSCLQEASYDPAGRRLELTFASGARYAYANVPGQVALELAGAESAGRLFARHIRGAFAFERLPAAVTPD